MECLTWKGIPVNNFVDNLQGETSLTEQKLACIVLMSFLIISNKGLCCAIFCVELAFMKFINQSRPADIVLASLLISTTNLLIIWTP